MYLCTLCHFVLVLVKYLCFPGVISSRSTATFDYETQSSYILEVTASDGEFEDIQILTIYIDDVNEKPFFTAATTIGGDILESETTSRVVLDMDASDPEGDVLTYEITGSSPSGAPFTIDSSTGIFPLPQNF